MIVDRIYEYLNSEGKSFNALVLDEALSRFRNVLMRQLMQDREEKPGRLYVTRFSHPCARKGAYGYHAFEAEEVRPRGKINFLVGDMVEIALASLGRLAGCDLQTPPKVILDINGTQVTGYGDDLLQEGGEGYLVEYKKVTSYALRRFQRNGVEDAWGYASQIHCYLKGLSLDKAILLAAAPETGALHEQVLFFDEVAWLAARNRASQILASRPERLPMRAIPTVVTKNGREKLGLQCSYCNYRQHCWPEAKMELVRGRPVWYVGEEE